MIKTPRERNPILSQLAPTMSVHDLKFLRRNVDKRMDELHDRLELLGATMLIIRCELDKRGID